MEYRRNNDCLFGRGVYKDEVLAECLRSVGYGKIAENTDFIAERVREMRWKISFDTGYDPDKISIPRQYCEITIWKGKTDPEYQEKLKNEYGRMIRELVSDTALEKLGLKKNA